MRLTPLVLALPALAAAEQFAFLDQVKGLFAKATDTISSAVTSATESIALPKPAASAAAKLAQLNVQKLTLDNHKEVLAPGAATASPGTENWLVFVTGGNKTCFGLCEHAEKAWNTSVPLISASPKAPHLAMLNCETDGVLCHAWAVGAPKLLHFQIPQPQADQSAVATTFRSIDVNRTTVTAPQIAAVILQDKYLETEPYEGFWHPFDGPLAKAGLNVPLGWVLYGFSLVPSWAFMIAVSFISRTFMSRKLPHGAQAAQQKAAAAQK